MKPIIKAENIAKKYTLGGDQAAYATLRESLSGAFSALLKKTKSNAGDKEFWALQDINFEIKPGETVGIIGSNGAGKSTLLKILSRITEPTKGEISIYGRVSSLLEVGTGFHHELTGRENIFLNGAILGMKREEIIRKFDEIVAFAEVEKFIDTPVKRYSSGMTVRLAFAVASHLEPEILIVDEVLAVGDMAFQKKCLGKMERVASEGRTVLFVSHNMAVVRQLCSRGILLKGGRITEDGEIEKVVGSYLQEISTDRAEFIYQADESKKASLLRVSLFNEHGQSTTKFDHTESFYTEIEYIVREKLPHDRLWWQLLGTDGVTVTGSYEQDFLGEVEERETGRYVARVYFPGGILNQGTYQCRLAIASRNSRIDFSEDLHFDISDNTDYGAKYSGGERKGVILQKLIWKNTKID